MNEAETRAKIVELEMEVGPLLKAKAELQQRLLEIRSPFRVGDIISWSAGSKQRKGQVVAIKAWVCGDPMWHVHNIRKDGSLGSIFEVRTYDKPVLVSRSPVTEVPKS